MNRGDIYWVDLGVTKGSEINKIRPCILVGANAVNRARKTVIVVPLSTSAIAKPPLTIGVNCLGKSATAVCDQIRSVEKTRLTKHAGHLSLEDLNALDNGLRQVLYL